MDAVRIAGLKLLRSEQDEPCLFLGGEEDVSLLGRLEGNRRGGEVGMEKSRMEKNHVSRGGGAGCIAGERPLSDRGGTETYLFGAYQGRPPGNAREHPAAP